MYTDDEDDKAMVHLPGSWLGEVYQVQYVLKIYVKHEGMFQFGAGSCVTMPIKLLNAPAIAIAEEPYRVPEGWNPIAYSQEPVYLYVDDSYRSDYFNRILKKNWSKYEKNVLPTESKEEEE